MKTRANSLMKRFSVLLYLIHLSVWFKLSLIFQLHLLPYNMHNITKIKPQIHHTYMWRHHLNTDIIGNCFYTLPYGCTNFGKSISDVVVTTPRIILPRGVRTGSAVSTGRWETTTSEGWMRGLSSVVRRSGSTLWRWAPGEGDNMPSPSVWEQGHQAQQYLLHLNITLSFQTNHWTVLTCRSSSTNINFCGRPEGSKKHFVQKKCINYWHKIMPILRENYRYTVLWVRAKNHVMRGYIHQNLWFILK